ncbi:unnamed protein product [Rotaria socialis]|uniref:Uncharacterized protein n=1 Tax=Rotaria socialis TaxID=392032 RepID=A0A821SIQ4_9BILA|nr:unnamed protein product [Rotaria socialis]CAF4860440.1 unnamed protein product [Rotaria socialis]
MLVGSTLVTAVCSVWNERLVKTCSVDIHKQNFILYFFGFALNLVSFFCVYYGYSEFQEKKQFFEGYSFWVIAIIICNSILGIAITFVYKYADAIVKTFSSACATGVLMYLNVVLFKLKGRLISYLGTVVIFTASYLFIQVNPITITSAATLQTSLKPTTEISENSKKTSKHKLHSIIFTVLVFFFCCILYFGKALLIRQKPISLYWLTVFESRPRIISIGEIYLNRPLEIHGIDLCNEATMNSTNISIDMHVCYPIRVHQMKQKHEKLMVYRSAFGQTATNVWKDSGSVWEPINERIIKIRLQCIRIYVTVIAVYSPINPTKNEMAIESDKFYADLQDTINNVATNDMVIIMGDLNA